MFITTIGFIFLVLSVPSLINLIKNKPKKDDVFKKKSTAIIAIIIGIIIFIVGFSLESGSSLNNKTTNNEFEDYVKENYPDTYEHYIK